ncbi:MAG: Ppx/GppA family phosphatase [Altererythrobacter sp.]|nr:Ppx/GppA family phosphatase [Altererythrobacter sp.]
MIPDSLRARLGLRHEDHERHAVIDIGSNTVRLVIYGGPPRAPAVLWNEKVSARLGRDLAASGAIPDGAMTEALAALRRYALIVAELGIARVDTVATAAAREATNGNDFVDRVREIGLPVRVLSGEEEARASALGAIGAFPGAEGVVADLGGGSLELVPVAADRCGDGATFPLGTLRLPALRGSGRFDRKVAKLLRSAVWASDADALFMVGGTWRALAAYAMRTADHPLTDPHAFTIAAGEATALAQRIAATDPSQLRGISTMRAEKLPDAAALLRVLLAELRPRRLIFSSWGLREGLYFETLSPREQALDPLLAGVAAFAHPRQAGQIDAELIADWTVQVTPSEEDRTGSLRRAAAHLAVALPRVEPNLRTAQSLEWALDKRWIGIDFPGRAVLAAALRGSLGITAQHPGLARLASARELREGTSWGLAFRLAQRLAAGAAPPLRDSRLIVKGGRVELRLHPRLASLATGAVAKDLAALSAWLDASPKLTTTE